MPTELRSDCRTGEATTIPFTPGPETIPTELDRAQLRLALTDAQIDTVQTALLALPAIKRRMFTIEWQHRSTIRRDSLLVKALGTALSLTDTQLDELFKAGALL